MTRKIGNTLYQGEDEIMPYSVTTTTWGSDPTDVVVKAYDVTGGNRTDVSDTVLTGSPSVSGDVITLPKVGSLTAKHNYRIEVKFSTGGATYEPYIEIVGEY